VPPVIDFLRNFDPLTQTLIATVFTWGMTALGAAAVFTLRDFNAKVLDTMLGFAGGVMIAASFWSLLAPAVSLCQGKSVPCWLPAVIGFAVGAAALRSIDFVLPHLHAGLALDKAEGAHTRWRRSTLLVLAITLHNIPEGLAIGVVFGVVGSGIGYASLAGAVALTLGLGIQNLPEGLAVSMPLRREGMSRLRSFWYGQLSAVVEPLAGVVGVLTVRVSQGLMPYALGFAAGAMIYVVVEEVIPESQTGGNSDMATIGTIIGFILMMILDLSVQ
jgi:ZIP family zinc transporter